MNFYENNYYILNYLIFYYYLVINQIFNNIMKKIEY